MQEQGVFSIAIGCIHTGREFGQGIQRKNEVDFLTGLITKADITQIAINLTDVRKVKVSQKVAGIMEKEVEVGERGIVGRIGGDEFLIIFCQAYDMENMRERLKCIKNTLKATIRQS